MVPNSEDKCHCRMICTYMFITYKLSLSSDWHTKVCFFLHNLNFLHHTQANTDLQYTTLYRLITGARPPQCQAHPRLCCHYISEACLKRDKYGPSRLWRAQHPFYPCLNSKQFYLYNNNPIMTFRMYENEFICLYEGLEAVSVVQASGMRSPQVPINNHSPTWDGLYGHTVSFARGLIYCGVITT